MKYRQTVDHKYYGYQEVHKNFILFYFFAPTTNPHLSLQILLLSCSIVGGPRLTKLYNI
jgi:hypothetical protein